MIINTNFALGRLGDTTDSGSAPGVGYGSSIQADAVSMATNILAGSLGASACVGTPGNNTGTYLSQCQDVNGIIYECLNPQGCTVASDWGVYSTANSTTAASTTSTNILSSLQTTISNLYASNPYVVWGMAALIAYMLFRKK
jgi:hypothetical protein